MLKNKHTVKALKAHVPSRVDLFYQKADYNFHVIFQVNGMDTVRIPMSLVPYEDPSARYQQLLKTQRKQQAAADVSEHADEEEAAAKAVSEEGSGSKTDKYSVSEVSEASASAAAATTETSQDTTAPPSDSQKKD